MHFTAEHHLFRRTVRDFLAREISPHVDDWEHAHGFPAHEVFPKLAEIGLLGLEYEPADGGQASTGWSERKRSISRARASAVAYRRSRSLSSAFKTIQSRSPRGSRTER